MSKRLPVDRFERLEETCQFNKDFIKSYNEDSDIGYYLGIFNILKNYITITMIYHCYMKEQKLKI